MPCAPLEDKRKVKPVRPQEPANDDKVVDLMAPFKKSLEDGTDGGRRERAERFVASKAKPRKSGGRTRAA
jgi:non-homologous end joining protein Ku